MSIKRMLSGAVLSLFLFVVLLAQFEALHHSLHKDSTDPSHQCIVTLLQHGHAETVITDTCHQPATQIMAEGWSVADQARVFDYLLLPPSCGPPLLLC